MATVSLLLVELHERGPGYSEGDRNLRVATEERHGGGVDASDVEMILMDFACNECFLSMAVCLAVFRSLKFMGQISNVYSLEYGRKRMLIYSAVYVQRFMANNTEIESLMLFGIL